MAWPSATCIVENTSTNIVACFLSLELLYKHEQHYRSQAARDRSRHITRHCRRYVSAQKCSGGIYHRRAHGTDIDIVTVRRKAHAHAPATHSDLVPTDCYWIHIDYARIYRRTLTYCHEKRYNASMFQQRTPGPESVKNNITYSSKC